MSSENGYTLYTIGLVRSSLKTTQDSPPDGRHALQEATLEIYPGYCLAMAGMQDLDRIIVFYWLHQADREVLRVYPGGDRNKEMIGVFCNRSPLRPNPIGFSTVDVVDVGIDKIIVRGLDAIDGTPIIDIKSATNRDDYL